MPGRLVARDADEVNTSSSMSSAARSQIAQHVTFNKAQVAYLEQLFPVVVFGPSATEAQLRHYHGQQEVVHAVKRRIAGSE